MLPDLVSQYLLQRDAHRIEPFVLKINADFQMLESWGNPAPYGLPSSQVFDDTRAALPFLNGLETTEPLSLSCIDPGTGHAVDVALLPQSPGCSYVVITSAEEQRRQTAQLQQTANETKLLYQRQQKLIDQLVETRSELEMRRHEAEEAMRGKSRFIASMSHEFRTPLTAVIGYAEWLTGAMDDNDPARRQANAIVRAGRHMVTLVDNILEQARLDNSTATVQRDSVDLRELAEDMSAIMAPLAADKGLGFAAYVRPQDVAPVVLDDMRIRQILINLLANAVKFTESGAVQLSLQWSDDRLCAEIADTGPGIAAADQSRIFTAFERTDDAQSRPGAGLGLHITLQLVRLLDGKMELESEPGQGSRFRITLHAPPAKVEVDAGPGASVGGRLLIAEDDPDLVQLMDLFLSRAGYSLEFAGNGRDAVELALNGSHDLVILDLNMPVMDGITAVQKLREGGFDGPVVALTGATLDEDRLHAIAAGFDGFVTKPIRMPELIATLGTLIE